MFPTRARDKIPKTLTYPLKAKFLSEELADVPQADEFELWFSSYGTPAKLRQSTEFLLLRVWYRHREVGQFTAHSMEERGYNDPRWTITVSAIPVEIRARVTQLLHDEGLPKIRAWLQLKADVSNQRSSRIEVLYNETDDELYYFKRET